MNAITSPTAETGNTPAGWRELLQGVGPRIEATGRECDRSGEFVAKNLNLLESMGFFALGVPADLGGGGASYTEVAAMLRALARPSPPFASIAIISLMHILPGWAHMLRIAL